ncbi:MAG: transcriptional activator RfaH [Rhodospirillales bacterium]|nr:transcriptional activator RfaH [Rhodospirillales bacterium]
MTYWCAVQTHVRSEDKAAFHLKRQGYDVFLPKHLKRRKHARRIDWVLTPLFPRYLFVAINPDTTPWWAIRSTVGVGSLICFGDTPAVVPTNIITEIQARQDEKGLVKLHSGCAFKPGDRVKIIDGPLNDIEGLFECPTDEDRVTVLLNLMGREVKVRVPLEAVYACA